jgi:hypothetical protein
MLGRCKERKEAPLGQACWTAGQCAWRLSGQNSKERKGMVPSFSEVVFFLCFLLKSLSILNQWDKIVRE